MTLKVRELNPAAWAQVAVRVWNFFFFWNFVYLWKVPWAKQIIGTYNLVSYIIENNTYMKFQIFVVVTGWVFTDNTQELIIIFCLRLKDFIRKIPRLQGYSSCECTHCVDLFSTVPPQGCEAIRLLKVVRFHWSTLWPLDQDRRPVQINWIVTTRPNAHKSFTTTPNCVSNVF